jgi:hypothetical protein
MNDLAIEIRPRPSLKPAGFINGDGADSDAALAKVDDTD